MAANIIESHKENIKYKKGDRGRKDQQKRQKRNKME